MYVAGSADDAERRDDRFYNGLIANRKRSRNPNERHCLQSAKPRYSLIYLELMTLKNS